jgi:hypothetical protein
VLEIAGLALPAAAAKHLSARSCGPQAPSEKLVLGMLQQAAAAQARVGIHAGATDADRNVVDSVRASLGDMQVPHSLAQVFPDTPGTRLIGSPQDGGKYLAGIAGEEAARPGKRLGHGLGHPAEAAVAFAVAMQVVPLHGIGVFFSRLGGSAN